MAQDDGVLSELKDPHDLAMLSPGSNPWLHRMLMREIDCFYSSDREANNETANSMAQPQDSTALEEDRMDSNAQNILRDIAGVQRLATEPAAPRATHNTYHDSAAEGSTSLDLQEAIDQAFPSPDVLQSSQAPCLSEGEASMDISDSDGEASMDISDGDGEAPTDISDGDGEAPMDISDSDGEASMDISDSDSDSDSEQKESGTCIPHDDEFATLMQDIEELISDSTSQHHAHNPALQTIVHFTPHKSESEAKNLLPSEYIPNGPPSVFVHMNAQPAVFTPGQLITPQPLDVTKFTFHSGGAGNRHQQLPAHPYPARYSMPQSQSTAHQSQSTAPLGMTEPRKAGKQALLEEMRTEQYCEPKDVPVSSFGAPIPFNVLVSAADPLQKQEEWHRPSKSKSVAFEVDVGASNQSKPVEQPSLPDTQTTMPPPAKRQKKGHESKSVLAKEKRGGSVARSLIGQREIGELLDSAANFAGKRSENPGNGNMQKLADSTTRKPLARNSALETPLEEGDKPTVSSGFTATSGDLDPKKSKVSTKMAKQEQSKAAGIGKQKGKKRRWRELNYLGWDGW